MNDDDITLDAPTAALVAQLGLAQALPGMSRRDQATMARTFSLAEDYALGADSIRGGGVARGEVTPLRWTDSRVYPGTARDWWVYAPARLDASKPAHLIVFQDGARYLGPECDAPAVLDNLIAEGAVAPTVALFVNPGDKGPGLPIWGGSDNRSIEYDSGGDTYARLLIDELIPQLAPHHAISANPAHRTICGLSSGGHCAFNAAWERPDAFGNVISHCGSFVDLRGGNRLASRVRREPRRALRVFLQTGERDLDVVFGHWPNANRELAAALAYRGYEHRLVVGAGGHSLKHGGAIFPETLRWIARSN